MSIKETIANAGKEKIFIGMAVLLVIGVSGAAIMINEPFQESEELDVVATFYPFYDIGQNIGGEQASFSTLVPAGADPHSYEASPQDIERLNNADVFIVTGAEFEEWEQDLMNSVDEDQVRVVDPSQRIDLLDADHTPDHHGHEEEHHGEEEHHEEEHHEGEHNGHDEHHDEEEHHEEEHNGHEHDGHDDHDHGQWDPHYWLSPVNAQLIAEEIGEALQEENPDNADYYRNNQEDYINELEQLDQDYQERLGSCEKDRILTTHAAFAYLGQEYGFSQIPITGLSHLTEPTAQELERLAHEAEEHDLGYVFYDSIVDPSVSETIAQEAGAETMVLHSIEGSQEDEDYLSLMKQNLENLEVALECQ